MENKMESKLTDRSVSDIAVILDISRQAVYNKFIHHTAPITVKELSILKDKLDYPTYDLLIEDIKHLLKVR